jgi:excisionase family DNA binding protein
MSHLLEQQIAEIKAFILSQTIRSKEVMSLREAAQYMNISKSFLYKLTCSRAISFSKPGAKIIFFKRSDLDEWMLTNRAPSMKELSNTPARRKSE